VVDTDLGIFIHETDERMQSVMTTELCMNTWLNSKLTLFYLPHNYSRYLIGQLSYSSVTSY